MTEVEKKVGKAKVGLMISVAMVAVLAVSNIWFYAKMQNESHAHDVLNSDFQILHQDYDTLSIDIDDLQQNYDNLQNAYNAVSANHENLLDEHEVLRERYDNVHSEYTSLLEEYDKLEDSLKLLYTTTIKEGNVTWSFQKVDGTQMKWHMPLDTYVYYVNKEKPEEYHLLALDEDSFNVRNMELFVEPEFFSKVIDGLTDGNSARDFVREVFNLRVQLTLYSADITDTPQWSGETMTKGTGDCEDFAILMASLLLAGNEYASFNMAVQMVYMDTNNPNDPQTVNHVMLYVTYEDDTSQFVESTSTDVMSPWSRVVGWYYDL